MKHVENNIMIAEHINTTKSFPTYFDILFKDYFKNMEECIMDAFDKVFQREVYGLDSRQEILNLSLYRNIYFALLLQQEQKDIDKEAGTYKTAEEYKILFHLNCENLVDKMVCMNCITTIVTSIIDSDSGEFDNSFDDSFFN